MCERLVKAAKACPSQAQSMRQSCSAHLLSIRLDQHGLPLHAAAYVHLELKKCCGFLELEVDYVMGFGKALRSPMRNRIAHRGLRRAFARWTECALGNRGKQRI